MKGVMGAETEYAISARDADGRIVDQVRLLNDLLMHVKRTLGYGSTSRRGRFLSNGGLLYLDGGLHLEWSTPEVTSPIDVVRYLKAGDRIVQALAMSFKNASGYADVFCSRASVDYVTGTLWAAHESYMHRARPDALPGEFTPFLASRVILGAGGWDYQSPALRFTMSPRAHFINHLTHADSQFVRPLFHTRNEPLGGTGTNRLHVACSESLCSDTGNVLRFGTTALVLALIEQGLSPGAEVKLAAPILALQLFAADDDAKITLPFTSRGRASAVGLQRHYLSLVEERLGDSALPEWAEAVCALWRQTLDALEAEGPAGVDATLDWAIKRRVFIRQLERRGIAWASLRGWDLVLSHLKSAWESNEDAVFDPRFALEPNAGLAAEMDRQTPVLERYRLSWDQLPDLVDARSELFELDAKFGALDERGVFSALEAAGALRHQVPGAEVGDAVERPPQDTRARIRGDVVRRLSAAGTRYDEDWTLIYDTDGHRVLDLSDPFVSEERWRAPALTEVVFLADRYA